MSGDIRDKLLGASDEELYAAINAVCAAAGIDECRRRALTADLPRLRRMLASLSGQQLSSIVGMMEKGGARGLFGGG